MSSHSILRRPGTIFSNQTHVLTVAYEVIDEDRNSNGEMPARLSCCLTGNGMRQNGVGLVKFNEHRVLIHPVTALFEQQVKYVRNVVRSFSEYLESSLVQCTHSLGKEPHLLCRAAIKKREEEKLQELLMHGAILAVSRDIFRKPIELCDGGVEVVFMIPEEELSHLDKAFFGDRLVETVDIDWHVLPRY